MHNFTNVKNINIIRKLAPSGYCSHIKWQIKLGDAGTIDHFGLAFQYQIEKYITKDGQKQPQIKNTI